MKQVFITILIVYGMLCHVYGQINTESNFYMQHPMLINPAANGISPATEALITYRDQWTGLAGAPKMFQAAVHGRLKQNSGIGLRVKSYQWGILDDKNVTFSFAHQVQLAQEHKLRFGVSTGFFHRTIDNSRLDVENPDGDMVLLNHYNRALFMQFGMGIMYQWKKFSASVSFPGVYDQDAEEIFEHSLYWLVYRYKLPSSEVVLTPSVQFSHSKSKPDQTHLALQASWKDVIWLQAGYKMNRNLLFGTGFKYDKIGFGYLFEHNNQTLRHLSYGSHEILLSYQFISAEKSE